jgi:hypothetical protein
MSDLAWLVVYLLVLLVPWLTLEGSALLWRRGRLVHPTMSQVIAHLEAREGQPLRVGISTVIALLALLLTLHLGFQAI